MWYILQVMTGDEHFIADDLRQRLDKSCYDQIFIPMYEERRKKDGIETIEKKRLFPSYIFVDSHDVMALQFGLQKFRYFKRLLKSADEIRPINEEEENYLKSLMGDDHIVRFSRGFIIGDKVCITEGALSHFIGRIKKIDRHHRQADLDVMICGRATRVKIGLEIVEKYKEEKAKSFLAEVDEDFERFCNERPDLNGYKTVTVTKGVFNGIRGKLMGKDSAEGTYLVLINMFGRDTMVTFGSDELEM
ncbi:MAG: antiterminator LoaP [Lachnospiraceae bacterium]|jgi:transcriptional antiterminator NusG|nr:antiterminator LoaP [Lachnospiraceae bacterium]MEE3461698.1 antiterminator LoaP [Lachnospiraceae bacterium]